MDYRYRVSCRWRISALNMNSVLKNVSIKAISVSVPKKKFTLKQIVKKGAKNNKIINSSKMLGVKQNYTSSPNITTLDLCYDAAKDVIKNLKWKSSDVDIVVFVTQTPELKGYGYSLWVVYAIWFSLILALYPVCKWYWNYKSNNRDKWWLSYL